MTQSIEYTWPNANPIDMFDATIDVVVEVYEDKVEADRLKTKIYSGLTEAAYMGTLSSIDFTYINDPLGLKALKQYVVPGILRWLNDFPEDTPILLDTIIEKGDKDE